MYLHDEKVYYCIALNVLSRVKTRKRLGLDLRTDNHRFTYFLL